MRVTGPYEKWMLDHGKHYDLPALGLQQSPYFTQVAELMDGAGIGAVPFSQRSGIEEWKRPSLGSPPLWDDDGKFNLTFLPFIGTIVSEETALSEIQGNSI